MGARCSFHRGGEPGEGGDPVRKTIIGTVLLALIAGSCGTAASPSASAGPGAAISYAAYGDYAKYGSTPDVPGDCSYASIDKKDYSGRTLSIITHAVPVMGEPTDLHAKQFGDLTGAKVGVVHVPFGDLFQRVLTPLQSGQAAYHIFFIA